MDGGKVISDSILSYSGANSEDPVFDRAAARSKVALCREGREHHATRHLFGDEPRRSPIVKPMCRSWCGWPPARRVFRCQLTNCLAPSGLSREPGRQVARAALRCWVLGAAAATRYRDRYLFGGVGGSLNVKSEYRTATISSGPRYCARVLSGYPVGHVLVSEYASTVHTSLI